MRKGNSSKKTKIDKTLSKNELDTRYDSVLEDSGFLGKEIINTISSDIFQSLDRETLVETLEQHSVYFDILLENGEIKLKIDK